MEYCIISIDCICIKDRFARIVDIFCKKALTFQFIFAMMIMLGGLWAAFIFSKKEYEHG